LSERYARRRLRHFPAFVTKTGVGTVDCDGKEHKDFNGETYPSWRRAFFPTLAIVKAWKSRTRLANLDLSQDARHFNPPAAMCGKVLRMSKVEENRADRRLDPRHPSARISIVAHR